MGGIYVKTPKGIHGINLVLLLENIKVKNVIKEDDSVVVT